MTPRRERNIGQIVWTPADRMHHKPGLHSPAMMHPKHPERICWGCDQLCSATELACANGTIRTPHPIELFGDDWDEWFSRSDRARMDEGP
jgi:hypothetical protein